MFSPLPPPLQGPSAQASWHNRNRQALRAGQVRVGPGLRVKETAFGVYIEIDQQGGGASLAAKTYRLKSVGDDFLTCRTWDGTTEGTQDIVIAKPYKLRTSLTSVVELGITYNFTYGAPGGDANNKVRTKTAAGGGASEDQLVTPLWTVNDEIMAIEAQTTAKDGVGNPISKIMIADSRQWAVKQ